MANRYSVLLKFLENLNSHLVFKFKGKVKFIAVTKLWIQPQQCISQLVLPIVNCRNDVWPNVIASGLKLKWLWPKIGKSIDKDTTVRQECRTIERQRSRCHFPEMNDAKEKKYDGSFRAIRHLARWHLVKRHSVLRCLAYR